jgi:hypothetical protein
VPNGNSEGLVRVIEEIRRDPALGLALGHRGRKALESGYSMRHGCEMWRDLLHLVTAGRTASAADRWAQGRGNRNSENSQ